MLPNVYDTLHDDATVAGLVSTRIYRHGSAPQTVTAPYITWSVAGGAPENGFAGACADFFRVQGDSWAGGTDGDAAVDTLASAVRAAMEPRAHCVAYVADERDFETQKYRISMAFDWIGQR